MSEGDLRKAITFLQSATRLTGGKEITEKVITDIAGVRLKFLVGFVAFRKFSSNIYRMLNMCWFIPFGQL